MLYYTKYFVMAGLILEEIADTLATLSSDAAMTMNAPSIQAGGRDLMTDNYREMLSEDKKVKGKPKERQEK